MKICTIFLKRITKNELNENTQLKVMSTRYFPGHFSPSLHLSEIYTKKQCGLFSYPAKARLE